MGLHEGPGTSNTTPSQEIERRNLIWAIYAIDKQRVFVKGSPCHIYLFECNLELPGSRDAYLVAHLQMTCLMEEIYKHLYSPKAKRQQQDQRQGNVERFDVELNAWLSDHEAVLSSPGILTLQLQYIFLSTMILVHRCSVAENNEIFRLDKARSALRIIHQILCSGTAVFDGELPALERSEITRWCCRDR